MTPPTPMPHDSGAERALIGACINDISCLPLVRSRFQIAPGHFYILKHQQIWKVLDEMDQSEGLVDVQQIRAELKKRDQWEKQWTVQDLIEITEDGRITTNAEYHAQQVARYATRRLVMGRTKAMYERMQQDGADVTEIMEGVDEILEAIQRSRGQTPERFADAIAEAEAHMEAIHEGDINAMKTGIEPLDDQIQGFMPGELGIIAGRPSSGKTAFACVCAYHIVMTGGGVSFISAESTRREIATRIMRIATGVDYATIQQGQFTASKYEKWQKQKQKLSDAKLHIDDTSRIFIEDLCPTALEHVRTHGATVIIIDHIQRIQTHHRARRHEQLEHIADRCKVLAREANVPVLLLSQLNRKNEGSPSLPKGSGAIEEIADTMIFLRYDAAYDDPEQKEEVHAERILDITKKREGPTGKVPVIFQKDVLRFVPRDESQALKSAGSGPRADETSECGIPF